ncbi:DnaD domain-containing protein [Lactobacillus terrae]|uniref:DnaD domain-containing protein n=1 Tax=Lactobacillus terrae TaxID=2269374 RepID=UPI000C1B67D3|nr:DnaD domain protein [Lactobacillus terrae]
MKDKILKKLIESKNTSINNLVIQYYKKLGMTEQDLVVYIFLTMNNQEGIDFPLSKDISSMTLIPETEVFDIIQNLIKLGIIELKTVIENHVQRDVYSLSPVYYKIADFLDQEENENQKENLQNKVQELFKKLEIEFGRPISPIEQEQVHQWINDDHYPVELIELALREAVLNQAYSLKYMDRILISWEKSNIKTAEQLQDRRKKMGY